MVIIIILYRPKILYLPTQISSYVPGNSANTGPNVKNTLAIYVQ